MTSISEWWMWLGFLAFVLIMLFVDLFVFGGRKAHRVSTKEALSWSILWFTLAIIFNFLLWWYLIQNFTLSVANEKALEFFTGYLIEKSLSFDNIFVFLILFDYFAIPAKYQHRVLIYGVIGAIVMRLILILLGIWIVNQFHWILYIFGLFLMITGVKMFIFADKKPELAKNPILQWMRNHLRITEELHGEQFFLKRNQLVYVTPLFMVLILIEVSDLIFAVDSIPAIFAITNDPFIVFTSNIFAILGLRALYFLLVNMHKRFYFLKYGLAFILVFVGFKMLIAPWFKIPIFIALGIVMATLVFCILFSVWHRKNEIN
ncbi:TPA: TerC/Alx family metal homeostasis membrane protein [Legionella pneumophila]|uniref:TerC family protein n=1 Tax=Legionella sp. PATHC039 TaxID=2992042 RepID=UPI00077822A8|nr:MULTISPECIES: TerC family protein [Legionella]HAT8859776.1 TerC/Alx family metal homeostasis membrane protein [Legionella pneumophila subsp. pneumophila]MCW8394355.1 TerC family protein [Legionella sp. PATHC039]HAT7071457.1 TerC/Alx family metal homeostasis membrane protein [Legionella pneumophila]HAT8640542.1 TerC/Alx family metal homeostasis membrane protein [Legionella pneumophila]HAT8866640.1 TerC/Alx family metal homeostasis membrane protein [Legionella pneumophila subsp. pneumophila]